MLKPRKLNQQTQILWQYKIASCTVQSMLTVMFSVVSLYNKYHHL